MHVVVLFFFMRQPNLEKKDIVLINSYELLECHFIFVKINNTHAPEIKMSCFYATVFGTVSIYFVSLY